LTDGFQTAAWMSENACEVSMVDLKMPKVDGISLISFIREMNPTLPVLVFTGVGYDEDKCMPRSTPARTAMSAKLPVEQLYCVLARILATCQQRKRYVQRPTLGTRRHSLVRFS
jgi:DNA-binding NtrC family response regulator